MRLYQYVDYLRETLGDDFVNMAGYVKNLRAAIKAAHAMNVEIQVIEGSCCFVHNDNGNVMQIGNKISFEKLVSAFCHEMWHLEHFRFQYTLDEVMTISPDLYLANMLMMEFDAYKRERLTLVQIKRSGYPITDRFCLALLKANNNRKLAEQIHMTYVGQRGYINYCKRGLEAGRERVKLALSQGQDLSNMRFQ